MGFNFNDLPRHAVISEMDRVLRGAEARGQKTLTGEQEARYKALAGSSPVTVVLPIPRGMHIRVSSRIICVLALSALRFARP
jgi:hypothetical protein